MFPVSTQLEERVYFYKIHHRKIAELSRFFEKKSLCTGIQLVKTSINLDRNFDTEESLQDEARKYLQKDSGGRQSFSVLNHIFEHR